jgi:hypothetical protein
MTDDEKGAAARLHPFLMYHVGFIYIGDTAPIIQLAS